MLTRRGFLGTLASAASALGYAAIAPDTLTTILAPNAAPAAVEAATKQTLEWVTRQIAMMVSNRVGPLTLCESDGFDVMTPHMWGVDLHPMEAMTPSQYRERYIEPIAASLASRMVEAGVTRCGTLPLPMMDVQGVVVSDPQRGMSLRGLEFYDGFEDLAILRFDVLAG